MTDEGFAAFSFAFPEDYNSGSGSDSDGEDGASEPRFKFNFGVEDVMQLEGKVSCPQVAHLPRDRNNMPVLPDVLTEGRRHLEGHLESLAGDILQPSEMAEDEDEDSEEIRTRRFQTTFAFDAPFEFSLGNVATPQAAAAMRVESDDEGEAEGMRPSFDFEAGETGSSAGRSAAMEQMALAAHNLLEHTLIEPKQNVVVSFVDAASSDDIMAHRARGRVWCYDHTKPDDDALERDVVSYFNRAADETYLVLADGKPLVMPMGATYADKLTPVGAEGVSLQELGNTIWRHIERACRENPDEKIGLDGFLILGYCAAAKVHKVAALLESRIDANTVRCFAIVPYVLCGSPPGDNDLAREARAAGRADELHVSAGNNVRARGFSPNVRSAERRHANVAAGEAAEFPQGRGMRAYDQVHNERPRGRVRHVEGSVSAAENGRGRV
jgi:hypothetical protein